MKVVPFRAAIRKASESVHRLHIKDLPHGERGPMTVDVPEHLANRVRRASLWAGKCPIQYLTDWIAAAGAVGDARVSTVEQPRIHLANIEAEQGILGALLADCPGSWPLIGQLLKPDHFAEHIHARIYAAIESLARAGKPASPITIKNLFDEDATLQEIGGMQYIARLVTIAAPRASLRAYTEVIRDLAARRAAIAAAGDLADEVGAVRLDQSVRPLIANHIETMQRLFDDGSERRTSFTLGEASNSMLERVERMRAGEADPNAIKVGIASLDKFTGGFHRGEYIILGARPSMGKTALARQIAYNVAGQGGGSILRLAGNASAAYHPPLCLLPPLVARSLTTVHYQNILRGRRR